MAVRLWLVLLSFLAAQPAFAQTALSDVELTTARVETVIAAYPLMRVRMEELDSEFEGSADAGAAASSLQTLALAGGVSGALNSAAAENGFADFMDWVTTTHAVFLAHAFAQDGGMDAQVQDALDNIDRQPGLSAAQKEQMKAMILQSMGVIEQVRPPDGHIAAVAPYHDQIEQMLRE